MSLTSSCLRRPSRSLALASVALGLLLGSLATQAQVLAMPDSINDRLVTFSAVDGSLQNAELLWLGGLLAVAGAARRRRG